MMRARVVAQGVTVSFIMAYAAYNAYELTKPKETDAQRDARILDPNRTTK